MKVKIIESISGNRFNFIQGEEPDIEEALAQELINAGIAEELEPITPKANKAVPKTESKTESKTETISDTLNVSSALKNTAKPTAKKKK